MSIFELDITVNCAKMAEPTEMSFGQQTLCNPNIHADENQWRRNRGFRRFKTRPRAPGGPKSGPKNFTQEKNTLLPKS